MVYSKNPSTIARSIRRARQLHRENRNTVIELLMTVSNTCQALANTIKNDPRQGIFDALDFSNSPSYISRSIQLLKRAEELLGEEI